MRIFFLGSSVSSFLGTLLLLSELSGCLTQPRNVVVQMSVHYILHFQSFIYGLRGSTLYTLYISLQEFIVNVTNLNSLIQETLLNLISL